MKPIAKAKRRAADRDADIEALKKYDETTVKTVKTGRVEKKPRNEVPTRDIVGVMADEIQLIYDEAGMSIDETNARDKALILWRDLSMSGVHAKDQVVPHVLCEDHE